MTNKWKNSAMALLLFAGAGMTLVAQTAKSDIKDAGRSTKQAAQDTGHATAKTAHKAKTKTKNAVHKAAGKVQQKTAPKPGE
jgi:hypothetical protein